MQNKNAVRRAQNYGVKQGTLRTGAKGKTIRKYNAQTGSWNVVANTSGTKDGSGAKRNYKRPSTAKSSKAPSGATGTYTKSYARKTMPGGSPTIPTFFGVIDQRRRENRRMAANAVKKKNAARAKSRNY